MKTHFFPLRTIALAMLVGLAAHAQAQQNSVDVEDEVTLILNAMSDEQRRLYCIGYGIDFSFANIKGVFNIRPIDDLELEDGRVIDLPLIHGVDGGIGFVGQGFEPGVRFPAGPLLASTWNPDRAYSLGDALGREGSARGIHRMLAPGSNFYRTPYNGRSFEYVTGEDPLLGATLLPPLVQAMQEHRVMATVKHPVVNDQEINRTTVVIEVDERTLREIYLPPFEAAVKLGDTAALMGSYNKLNGDYATDQVNGDWACESHFLLTQVFKEDWGFPGFVESDFLAIHDGVKAAQAGIDIDMPGGIGSPFGVTDFTVMTPEDLQQSGADIDDKVRRMLRRIVEYDFINNPPQENQATIDAAAENSKEVVIQTAREGIVLLENRNPRPWNRHFTKKKRNLNRHNFDWHRNLLPLNKHSIKKIAVIGPNAEGEPPTGSGSAHVPPSDDFISVIDGIKSLAPGATVDFIAECVPDSSTAEWQTESGDQGLDGQYFPNPDLTGTPVERVDTYLDFLSFDATNVPAGIDPSSFSGIWRGAVTPTVTGDHVFKVSSVGKVRLYVNDQLIIDDTSDVQTPPLTPDTPVSGAPPLVPISGKIFLEAGVPAAIELQAMNLRPSGFGTATALQVGWASLQPPADLATYDAVVLAVGSNGRIQAWAGPGGYDGENYDRSFRLPELQDDLILNATELNPNTIVVLHGGGGFSVQAWADKVGALLHAWFPGQYGGQALAEILFGKVNPSGKLPITMEKRIQDNPAFATFPTTIPVPESPEDKIVYSEGLFVGYRGYEKNRIEPQYPFGYGLSYTKFRYSDLEVEPMVLKKNIFKKNIFKKDDDLVRVSFRIRNIGKRAGAEIAQLYVAPVNPPVERPVKELKGYQKVFLKPGESKKVTISLDRRSLAYYNVGKGTWDVAPGVYRILVGSSSQDIELRRPLVNLFPSSLSVLESTPVPGAKRLNDLNASTIW
ncbi:MAG TPA: glycoside hydrolase family 3 C-terminal domain-containing protein [Chthoniobacterales bacterium]